MFVLDKIKQVNYWISNYFLISVVTLNQTYLFFAEQIVFHKAQPENKIWNKKVIETVYEELRTWFKSEQLVFFL